MKVLTHSPLPSRAMLISTGSGILAGSPIAPTSFAFHSPWASCLTSQSFEVSAVAVIAQFPYAWKPEPEQVGAGPYGASEPESRAVIDWAIGRFRLRGRTVPIRRWCERLCE